MKTFIHKCKTEDLAPCAKLLVSVYSEPPYNEKWKLSAAKTYLERFRKADPEGCFVAKTDGRTIGAIFSFSYPWQAGKSVLIQELFVSPKQRRKGVGKQLLSKINHGQKTSAWLVAHRESKAAKFYKKMGFSLKGPYQFHHGVINPPA